MTLRSAVAHAAAPAAEAVADAPVTVRGDAAPAGVDEAADVAEAADDAGALAEVEAGALVGADEDDDPPDEHPAAATTAAPAATAPPSLSIDEAEPNMISFPLLASGRSAYAAPQECGCLTVSTPPKTTDP
ncbi:MAG TPA: hypothetical protein VGG83_07220 [Trebonia sp.]